MPDNRFGITKYQYRLRPLLLPSLLLLSISFYNAFGHSLRGFCLDFQRIIWYDKMNYIIIRVI